MNNDAFDKAIEEILIKGKGGFSDPRIYYREMWQAAVEYTKQSLSKETEGAMPSEGACMDFISNVLDGYDDADDV
jgi:hypothetical protein